MAPQISSKTENTKMHIISRCHFLRSSTYHTQQLSVWQTSPAIHVMIYCQLFASPGKMEPLKTT